MLSGCNVRRLHQEAMSLVMPWILNQSSFPTIPGSQVYFLIIFPISCFSPVYLPGEVLVLPAQPDTFRKTPRQCTVIYYVLPPSFHFHSIFLSLPTKSQSRRYASKPRETDQLRP